MNTPLERFKELIDKGRRDEVTLKMIRDKLEEAKISADQEDLRAFLVLIEEVYKLAGVKF